jgi:hypothetical protein
MSKGKTPETAATGFEKCKTDGCKQPEARFTFCGEHYEWFKFGLITKAGQKVSDFDKKFGHYTNYVEKQKQHKAA